jgi:hypothetical protein
MTGTSSPGDIFTKRRCIAALARSAPSMVLTTLAHHIDVAWLREAYRVTRKNAAPGVDGQTAAEYAQGLEDNLEDLLGRFKSGRYRAPPVRRVEIPKGDGRSRPIGIPTFEDKVLQRAVPQAGGSQVAVMVQGRSSGPGPRHGELREACDSCKFDNRQHGTRDLIEEQGRHGERR